MTYPSKVDSWVGIVLVLVPVGILLQAVFLRSIVVAVVAASIPVLYGLAVFPTNYTIGPDALTVRSGVIRTSIPYQEIRQVRGSRSWLSAPASRSTGPESHTAAPARRSYRHATGQPFCGIFRRKCLD